MEVALVQKLVQCRDFSPELACKEPMKRVQMPDKDRAPLRTAADLQLRWELVAHFRNKRSALCEEWVRRILHTRLLSAMTPEEIFAEATAIYDNYVKALQTGSVRDLQAHARDLSRRIIHRGVKTHEVLGIVLLLRDVLARSLFKKYRRNFQLLNGVFDAYEPAANRIANTVAVSFVEQRESVIRRQQKAIQVLHVQEEERKRISRELHDEIGQALSHVLAHLTDSQGDSPVEPDWSLKTRVADLQKLVLGAMDRVHSFARELRPAMLDDLGLLPALRSYLKQYAERTGLHVHFEQGARNTPLNDDQKTALFRVAQEGLTNVAKHAQATEVEVALCKVKNGVRLRIKDNGKGFVMKGSRSLDQDKRLGLLGMQERMGLVNGWLSVQTTPGKGTTVLAEIPLQSAARARAA
jgi:signal transduction histidine kinase